MNQKQIPDTDSIEELAKFWDTHDMTDFENELEEVEGPVFSRPGASAIDLKSQPQEANADHSRSKSSTIE